MKELPWSDQEIHCTHWPVATWQPWRGGGDEPLDQPVSSRETNKTCQLKGSSFTGLARNVVYTEVFD